MLSTDKRTILRKNKIIALFTIVFIFMISWIKGLYEDIESLKFDNKVLQIRTDNQIEHLNKLALKSKQIVKIDTIKPKTVAKIAIKKEIDTTILKINVDSIPNVSVDSNGVSER